MAKNEVKCYVLTIPTQEFFDHWMKNDHDSTVFRRIHLLGINPDPESDAQHLLFATPEDRKEAYRKIHEVYPDTLCAFNLQTAYVDIKYLKNIH